MRDVKFLKGNPISNKGIYDNNKIYENTIEAFKKAIDHKLIIHLKVRLTKDKVPIIYSDNNLTRLMNLKDKINQITYDELIYLNKYHVPTLKEVLKLINGKVPIIINPKCCDFSYFLEKEIINNLDNYKGKVAFLSSNPLIIRWFNKNKSEIICGEILTKSNKTKKRKFISFFVNFIIKVDFKSIDIKSYSILKLQKAKENSIVLGYLIETKEEYNLYKNALDNVFIDELYK